MTHDLMNENDSFTEPSYAKKIAQPHLLYSYLNKSKTLGSTEFGVSPITSRHNNYNKHKGVFPHH